MLCDTPGNTVDLFVFSSEEDDGGFCRTLSKCMEAPVVSFSGVLNSVCVRVEELWLGSWWEIPTILEEEAGSLFIKCILGVGSCYGSYVSNLNVFMCVYVACPHEIEA